MLGSRLGRERHRPVHPATRRRRPVLVRAIRLQRTARRTPPTRHRAHGTTGPRVGRVGNTGPGTRDAGPEAARSPRAYKFQAFQESSSMTLPSALPGPGSRVPGPDSLSSTRSESRMPLRKVVPIAILALLLAACGGGEGPPADGGG